jgi:hypothetical protein
MSIQAAPERRTKVHEVTLAQVFWTEPERGAPGALTLQLIVDQKVEGFVIQAAPGDAAVLLEFLTRTTGAVGALGCDATGSGSPAAAASNVSRTWAPASFMRT